MAPEMRGYAELKPAAASALRAIVKRRTPSILSNWGCAMSSASTKSTPRDPSWIARLGTAIPGLVPTVVLAFLGAAASTWFSDRSSTWTAFVTKIDKDADSARSAYGDAADLINARWYALYKMAAALQTPPDSTEFGEVRKAFAVVDQDWALKFTKIESDIQFYVDETFPIGVNAEAAQRDIDLIPSMSCTKMDADEKARALLVTSSARVVMEIVNHCLGDAKNDLDGAMALKANVADDSPRPTPRSGARFKRWKWSIGPTPPCAASFWSENRRCARSRCRSPIGTNSSARCRPRSPCLPTPKIATRPGLRMSIGRCNCRGCEGAAQSMAAPVRRSDRATTARKGGDPEDWPAIYSCA
jgi:hypothetical protein